MRRRGARRWQRWRTKKSEQKTDAPQGRGRDRATPIAEARVAGMLGGNGQRRRRRSRRPPIAIRTNFNPLAAFSPSVKTGADGKATVDVKMPDNLTRYRVVAIAVAGDKQFGKGESAITARLPLMVRPSPPRFLNFGDTFQLPVVVQNQTDAPMTVQLAARTANVALTDGAGREVTVPANDRVEVQFPAAAEHGGHGAVPGRRRGGHASDARTSSCRCRGRGCRRGGRGTATAMPASCGHIRRWRRSHRPRRRRRRRRW